MKVKKRGGSSEPFYGGILSQLGSLNFVGINPMRALVVAGIVQGFSMPPLLLLLMKITDNRSIMGDKVNGRAINVLGWLATTIIFLASAVWSFVGFSPELSS